MKKQWTEYLERGEIKIDEQFRFRTEESCVTSLSRFYSKVINKK